MPYKVYKTGYKIYIFCKSTKNVLKTKFGKINLSETIIWLYIYIKPV